MKTIFVVLHLACLTGSLTFGSSVHPMGGLSVGVVAQRGVDRNFGLIVGHPKVGTEVRVGTRVGLGHGGIGVGTGVGVSVGGGLGVGTGVGVSVGGGRGVGTGVGVSIGGGLGVGTGVGIIVGGGLGVGTGVGVGARVGGVAAGVNVNAGMGHVGVATAIRSSGRTIQGAGQVASVGVGVVVPGGRSPPCDRLPCGHGLPPQSVFPVHPRDRRSVLPRAYQPMTHVYREPFVRVNRYPRLPVFRSYPVYYD